MAEQPPPGHIRIVRSGAPDVVARMGDGSPALTSGLGGWTEIQRPRDIAMTEWDGTTPFRFTVPVVLDGLALDRSVQPQLDRIVELGRGRSGEAPEIVDVLGAIPHHGRRVVLEQAEFGDRVLNEQGVLVRQALTLHFLKFIGADRIRFRRRGKGRPRRTRVREGENLRKVATRALRDASRAREIGRLNGIRDVRRPLRTGRVLRLP